MDAVQVGINSYVKYMVRAMEAELDAIEDKAPQTDSSLIREDIWHIRTRLHEVLLMLRWMSDYMGTASLQRMIEEVYNRSVKMRRLYDDTYQSEAKRQ